MTTAIIEAVMAYSAHLKGFIFEAIQHKYLSFQRHAFPRWKMAVITSKMSKRAGTERVEKCEKFGSKVQESRSRINENLEA